VVPFLQEAYIQPVLRWLIGTTTHEGSGQRYQNFFQLVLALLNLLGLLTHAPAIPMIVENVVPYKNMLARLNIPIVLIGLNNFHYSPF
jgi:hypothetical protein